MSFDPTKYTRSKFLKGEDLDGAELVTIERAYEHEFEGRDGKPGEVKPALEFSDMDQDLILNRTNLKSLISFFGPEVDAWAGKQIMLIRIEDAFQGKPGIRLQKPMRSPTKRQPAQAAPAQGVPESLDDVQEIPF